MSVMSVMFEMYVTTIMVVSMLYLTSEPHAHAYDHVSYYTGLYLNSTVCSWPERQRYTIRVITVVTNFSNQSHTHTVAHDCSTDKYYCGCMYFRM